MKFCSKCGKELADEAQFCPVCGNEVSNQNETTSLNEPQHQGFGNMMPPPLNVEEEKAPQSYGEQTEYFTPQNNEEINNPGGDNGGTSGSNKKLILFGIIAAAIIIAGGIIGYYFYVQSAKKTALLQQTLAWEDYLKLNPEGQIINSLGKGLLDMSNKEFREYGFENYVAGKLEGSDISSDNMSGLMEDLKLEVGVSANIKSMLSESLQKQYENIGKAGKVDWNPVEDLADGQYIVLTGIDAPNKEETAVVSYRLDDNGDDLEMVLKKDRSTWKVEDFKKDGKSFVSLLEEKNKKAQAQAAAPVSVDANQTVLYMAGAVDGKYRIHMALDLNTGSGKYYYDKYGGSNPMYLDVTGNPYSARGYLSMDEYNGKGEYCGSWSGNLTSSGYSGEGNFQGKYMPFKLTYCNPSQVAVRP